MPTALFVIDMQKDLASIPETRIPDSERLIENCGKVLGAARAAIKIGKAKASTNEEVPSLIVFVQHEEPPTEGAMVRGSEPWKLVFEPLEGEETELLVAKTTR
jgi:nicotinamidase-related amidase